MEATKNEMLGKLLLVASGVLVGYAFRDEIEELIERYDELGPIVYARLQGERKEEES